MSWTALLVFVIGGLAFFLFAKKKKRPGEKAPSIGSYPIVGSYFHLREPLARNLLEDFPGVPVVQVQMGLKTAYFLNTSAAIREAFVEQGDKFSGRSRTPATKHLFGDADGIVLADGEVWKEYRRFSLKTLRDFGFGRKGAEEIISVEIESLVRMLETQAGTPVELSFQLSVSVSNVICQLVFGSRLASEDAEFKKIAEIFRNLTQNEEGRKGQFIMRSTSLLLTYFPFLTHLVLLFGPSLKSRFEDIRSLLRFCAGQIDAHKKLRDPNAEAKDYIEAHLRHQQGKEEMFTDTRLTMAIRDLFIAGTDTTSNTLRWGLLYMAAFPEVADKVFQEIQAEIGTSRPPQMSDRPKLNYVNATIEEINRLASLAPEGVPHRATEDAVVAGFCIEKEALVKANIYGVHYNPEVFPEPEKLKPERHLTAEGSFKPHEDVMPFGVGRRACLGESLARMELFLFFTSVMQRFRVQLAPGEKDARTLMHDCRVYGGGVRAPDKHKLVFTERS